MWTVRVFGGLLGAGLPALPFAASELAAGPLPGALPAFLLAVLAWAWLMHRRRNAD